MSIIVISPKVSVHSAKNLAETLGVRYNNPFNSKKRNFLDYDVVINYGFSHPFHHNKVINSSFAVNKSLDKIETLSLLERKERITIPYTLNRKQALEWLKTDGVVVARKTADGTNSNGIVYCEDEEMFKNTTAVFWTRFVEHTHELRVNCWKDKIVSIYDKKTIENKKGEQEFKFNLFKGQENHPQLVNIIEYIYQKIGLDWYGVDILRTNEGILYVLEVNSAPILFPYTLTKLADIINKEYNNV